MANTELEHKFKTEMCEHADEVDPTGEQDWFSLSLGWAIGKGLTFEAAWEFAVRMRYTLHYFHD